MRPIQRAQIYSLSPTQRTPWIGRTRRQNARRPSRAALLESRRIERRDAADECIGARKVPPRRLKWLLLRRRVARETRARTFVGARRGAIVRTQFGPRFARYPP